ncbi:MAG: hypothetical protein ACLP2Y_05565 [Limisphaerales bacterium]
MAAIVSYLLFPLLAVQFKLEATKAAGLASGTTFFFRVLAIQFNWKSSSPWQEPPALAPSNKPGQSAPAKPPDD